ncbi:MAG TPA: 2,5-diamino-6-(ribosylamino)-4(3H)-pyrimidinone 5'-phosphate reductase [Sulfurihydrogenibium sp.]|uniref:2,5-diamino-6-(ribosylamino)-4(3H)-pyrimidinone 5'-phosphate reductase n=1 Tax=Sulfurihydrogenibium sp. (strain YO3AOP1) TaxID=436114 RepID=UPI0001722E22|nr:2,5-diamino-6-(ribosylamino)-4(3H)-pyrimidinone 5'-phosphate reductase [Sulfurihydrogenibium sp. YO3AOP1]ACD65871.1 2,5-diamino-6-hydroxy-4-(5-phosphoribosylamino)pyrimidine 1-reductase [Sulfurihydrogenibium sp. YO3AOP1]HBT99116.1 2,5-diamino-6-(ribosylamino)-4(3H)-pyrimidinone 5'-phosphate reductase [Sulfurihydrogenibium sp.]
MKRPYVIIVSEVTVDGKLTLSKGVSSKEIMKFMDEEANRYLHETRAKVDGIMVGAETIRTDNPYLTVRYVSGKNPTRIIPTSTADIPLDANILKKDSPTIIVTTEKAPEERVKALSEKVEVIVAGKEEVDLIKMMDILYNKGIRNLMVEGGSTLNWNLIKNGLVDEIRIIHMPFIVGGTDTPTLVGGEGFKSLEEVVKLKLRAHFMRGSHLITEWEVKYEG